MEPKPIPPVPLGARGGPLEIRVLRLWAAGYRQGVRDALTATQRTRVEDMLLGACVAIACAGTAFALVLIGLLGAP